MALGAMLALAGGGARAALAHGLFTGWVAHRSELAPAPPPRPSGEIWLYSVNGLGEVHVDLYGPDGRFNPAALTVLDDLMRCKRTGKVKRIDPRLYEDLSRVYDHYQVRIDLVSGYRNQRNHESKHYKGEAVDFHVPGVADRDLRDWIETHIDTGGMGLGYYPNAGFVHMDIRPTEVSYRWVDRSGHKWDGWEGPPVPVVARAPRPRRTHHHHHHAERHPPTAAAPRHGSAQHSKG